MSIRILDCAPMSPYFPHWHVGAPCLLVETDHGLVLVDTGLGLHDYASPAPMVRAFSAVLGAAHDPEQTAVRQLARLGYRPEDIRHIVLTHLHFDHAGGLPDFQHAHVHVHRREYTALQQPRWGMALAYDPLDFAHSPRWALYERIATTWFGFDVIRLPFAPEMYLVPLFGHTHGHCGVAIQDDEGAQQHWLFQCADALPVNARFDLTPQWLNRLAIGPHVPRLRALAESHPEVRVIAGHMWQSSFKNNPDSVEVV
jgi:glyoxylase-like metal-dependent hydrolase (beta-lactamase superfamily II)